jgi:hypothetical protein
MRMRRPSAAMVVAIASLVSSAGGGVTARVLITSADIADETIRSADIRNGTIDGADVHNGALTGVDIAHDSLTGADVDEESLSKVPDAARLDGLPATRFVRKAEVTTRHFSCAGTAFENGSTGDGYGVENSMKYGAGGSSPTLFLCSVNVPDGARVTEVSFSVRDDDVVDDVQCSMWRRNINTAVVDATQPMAEGVTTTGSPGDVRITDTTIERPVIDNDTFSYFVECGVSNSGDTGLFGAIVTYRVTAG